MDAREAQSKFRAADRFFRQGYFHEALDILVELDTEFPNTADILYPKALCCEKLGRHEEAVRLAEKLADDFHDPRVLHLMPQEEGEAKPEPELRPEPPKSFTLDLGTDLIDDLLGVEPQPEEEEEPRNWKPVKVGVAVVLALAALGTAALGVAWYFAGSIAASGNGDGLLGRAVNIFRAMEAAGIVSFAVLAVLLFFGAWLFLYGSMAALRHLQGDSWQSNLADISLATLIVVALQFLPVAGTVISLVYLRRHYDLNWGDLAIIVVSGVIYFLMLLMTMAPLAVRVAILLQ
jgi:tetratricopeptide (TPR) repeat protein